MKRGFVDAFISILLAVILGLVLVLVVVNTAPVIGNGGQAIATGANMSAAAQAIGPQFSTLWAVTGLGIVVMILAGIFGRKG